MQTYKATFVNSAGTSGHDIYVIKTTVEFLSPIGIDEAEIWIEQWGDNHLPGFSLDEIA